MWRAATSSIRVLRNRTCNGTGTAEFGAGAGAGEEFGGAEPATALAAELGAIAGAEFGAGAGRRAELLRAGVDAGFDPGAGAAAADGSPGIKTGVAPGAGDTNTFRIRTIVSSLALTWYQTPVAAERINSLTEGGRTHDLAGRTLMILSPISIQTCNV